MTTSNPHRRPARVLTVSLGLLVTGLLAAGLAAIASAGGATATSSRPRAITGAIHLDRSLVRPGGRVRGRVVFENRTSRTRVLMRGCKVDGLYGIGTRASDGYLQAPAFSAVGCSPEQALVARPGRTVYRFRLRASYLACSQTTHEPPKGSKYWLPLCLKDSTGQRDVMPPLPPGNYRALFFPDGKWHGPHVKPAELVVMKP